MIFSVSEANNFIKALLDAVPQLQTIFVRGEISNYKLYPSGHHYFTLKDEGSALKCVMFRGMAGKLRFRPENGMKVIAFDIYQVPVISEQLDIPYVEMDELLAKSDFISVHAPAVDGGALINAERIAKMKDGVVFIDNARGELMDIDAVTEAVESGKFGALFMDAFPGETGIIHVPHDEDIIRTPGMPYFKLKYLRSFVNVYHTPHMAFFTEEAAEQMAECGVNSIYEILTEGKSKHEIPC